jgi:hypothetical protein
VSKFTKKGDYPAIGVLERIKVSITLLWEAVEGGNAQATVGFILLPVGIFLKALRLPWEFRREERLRQPLKVLHLPVFG